MESAIRAASGSSVLAKAAWTRIEMDGREGMEAGVRQWYSAAGEKPFSAVPASYAHYAGKVIGTSIGFDSVEKLEGWTERLLKIAERQKKRQ